MRDFPVYIAGEPLAGSSQLAVVNPYTQQQAYSTFWASAAQLEQATRACVAALPVTTTLPTWQRADVLDAIAAGIAHRAEELTTTIVNEAGKPYQYARAEVTRATSTFREAAAYVRTHAEEMLPLDQSPGNNGRLGLVRRMPIGPVLCISPFNFPLNLVAHKLAPAIMAGCPFLLKPAPRTPITASILTEIILAAGYPPQAVNLLHLPNELAQQAVADDRFALLSFTGSEAVGWALKQAAGRKKVLLELGGDAAVIVCPDTDIEKAARECAIGAYAYAGQICISVQRILIEKRVYAVFKEAFLQAIRTLPVGDPANGTTVVGPMIDSANVHRVVRWLAEARGMGAEVHGGEMIDADANLIQPAVLEQLPRNSSIAQNEAFAPLCELIEYEDLPDAIDKVNASQFGLQAAIYTDSQSAIRAAWEGLQVGGLIVNAAPTLRIDAMPYGGIKQSGLGREGPRYAYEEMTEPRLLVW